MRHTLFAIVYATTMLVGPHTALAAPPAPAGACYNIASADGRAMCLARAHRDPSRCYNVQQADLRAICMAEARR